jgi:hypothetical protein
MLNINLGQAPAKPIKTISGLRLGKAVRRYAKRRRAQDAARWIRGEVVIVTPTIKLAASVFGVSAPLVRAQLDRCAKHHANGNGDGITTLSDDVVERIVAEVGVERVWRAVDRLTQPTLPLQAAEAVS